MHLRNRRMIGFDVRQAKSVGRSLREEQEALQAELYQAKGSRPPRKSSNRRPCSRKVGLGNNMLQYNAFADTLGQDVPEMRSPYEACNGSGFECRKGRDFYWAENGWYVVAAHGRACNHRQPLRRSGLALMTDTSPRVQHYR